MTNEIKTEIKDKKVKINITGDVNFIITVAKFLSNLQKI